MTVYSLHVLQKRVQTVLRLAKQGVVPSIEDLETIRDAMLQLWHDAHRLTPGVPPSYEEFHGSPQRRG